MPNAYYWWQGGREGGQKSQKPAYVIHGCSLDQFKKLESLYCKLHRGKLFMWHHLVAKCKNEKPSKLHQKQFWIPNKVLNSTSHKSMKNKLIVFSITDHYAPQSYQFCMNIKQGFKSCQKFIMRMKKKMPDKNAFKQVNRLNQISLWSFKLQSILT